MKRKDAMLPAAYTPSWGGAAVATVAVLMLYVLTLAPTTAFWDTSEYIASAHVLGIPHPPGNPLFVLLARTWDLLLSPTGLSVAVRINLFSAVMSALAHGCWFLLAERILATYSDGRFFRRAGAAAAVLLSATAFTVWNQSNVNEKVYTVSLFTIALLAWLAMRWRDGVGRARNDNLALLAVFVLALSVGNHLMTVLAAPALLVFVGLVQPRLLVSPRFLALAVAAAAIGLSVQLFLPIRAQLSPLVNEADPRCETIGSAVVSIYTFGKHGCASLSESLTRKQYAKPSMSRDPIAAAANVDMPRSPALLGAQLANYIQYFDWQWARSVAGNFGWFGGARPVVSVLFVLLGCYGAWSNWRRDRASAALLAVLMLTLSIGLVVYLNFKYGFTSPWRDATNSNTEVRERDYFFIVSFSIWGVWCGIGLAALWQRLSKASSRMLLYSPVMTLALIPLCANWSWASRAGDHTARDWSYNLLMSIEPYGVLLTNGDNDTFPLWYLQEAEGVRQDVTVIVMSYLNTDWYARQLRNVTTPCASNDSAPRDRTTVICQREFVAPAGDTLYPMMDRPGDSREVATASAPVGTRRPTHSILPLSDAEIARDSRTAYLAPASTFRAGQVVTQVAEATPIDPADIFLAQIIQSSIDDRPIYFAMTTTSYVKLGLGGHLVRQGVALKLMNGPVKADATRGIVEVDNGNPLLSRFVDVPRTYALATRVFVHHPGFPERWTHWTDAATENIPFFYASTLQLLAIILDNQGNRAVAQELMQRAEPFVSLSSRRTAAAAAAAGRRR